MKKNFYHISPKSGNSLLYSLNIHFHIKQSEKIYQKRIGINLPKQFFHSPSIYTKDVHKRQNWDTAAYTVTMDNRKISSQNNVNPGRLEYYNNDNEAIYSDARALTLYELMIIMSLPKDWPVPLNTSEAFVRRIIGEGIPPLFVKKVFMNIGEKN